MKGDDSAKTVPVWCCYWRTCFGPFCSIATSSFDRIYPGIKHFIGSGCWSNCVSQCCVRVFHSWYQSTLIPLSTFIRPMWLQRLSPHTLFFGSKCWLLPKTIHPMWNRDPHWKAWYSLETFSRTLSFITKKGAVSSKILNLFIHAPLLMSDDVRWYFPGMCCLRDQNVALLSGFHDKFPHVSPFTKGDDSAKTVPVWYCFWQTCFGPFRSIPTSSFDRIYLGIKYFVERGCAPNWVSQWFVRLVSLTVPKHLDSCSPFHKSNVTSRAFSSHFVFWF